METINLFRLSVVSTFFMFMTALVTPAVSIAVNLSSGPNTAKYLEFVCVYCQYGSTANDPFRTGIILNLTPFDFYFMWIPILLLVLFSIIIVLYSFGINKFYHFLTPKIVINCLWLLSILALLLRGLYSILIRYMITHFQQQYPNNQIIGELSWSAGALVIGAIMATTSAMIGFIEFQYQIDEEQDNFEITLSS